MNRNSTARVVLEDQIDDERAMETSITRIESDVAHLKDDVSQMRQDVTKVREDLTNLKDYVVSGFNHSNEAIASLREGQAELSGEIKTLRAETKAQFSAVDAKISRLEAKVDAKISELEVKIIKWIVGTAVGCAGMAFSLAKLIP
jgi:predicted  nucleic acid-binding Zn-ribbon protein